MKIGPTGDFPEGKISPTDEGGLTLAVSSWKGEVRIDFGAPVSWLSMPPQTAIKFAEHILARAKEVQ